jgi:hypothetical protein
VLDALTDPLMIIPGDDNVTVNGTDDNAERAFTTIPAAAAAAQVFGNSCFGSADVTLVAAAAAAALAGSNGSTVSLLSSSTTCYSINTIPV